jgi:hypothetical protein
MPKRRICNKDSTTGANSCAGAALNTIALTITLFLLHSQTDFRKGRFDDTVKPAHVVTSIKQSPVLKGHPFLVLS